MLCFHLPVKRAWYSVTDRAIQLWELFLHVCVCSAIYITSKTVYAYLWIILYAYLSSSGLKRQPSPLM